MTPKNLSFPVETLRWNGSTISKLPEAIWQERLELLSSFGIDEVMLSGYVELEQADFNMAETSLQMGEKLRELGFKCAQHHGLCPTFAPLDSSQEPVLSMLKRQIDYSSNLSARVLVIHPGRMLGRFQTMQALVDAYEKEEKRYSMEAIIEVCAENLHIAGDYAIKCGVLIALENVDRFEPLSTPQILPRLIEMCESSAIGYCFDSGHAHCCGNDPVMWTEIMGEKLFTTHFHDNHGPRDLLPPTGFFSPVKVDEHLPPGFGTIDWFGIIASLEKIGYSHTVNFESGPWYGDNIKEGYRSAINFWRTCENYLSR